MRAHRFEIHPLEPRLLLTFLPDGFIEEQIVTGLREVTSMAIAPDGRIFVSEQPGTLRVIKNGQLLPTPFVDIPTHHAGEQGLVGIAFHPNFEQEPWVYLFYTADWGVDNRPPHTRISRFLADGDVAVPGSEQVLLRLDDASEYAIHNGGAMRFGLDGKLYITAGDNANPVGAQQHDVFGGKMLRINPDGTIPEDNPFYNANTGDLRAIWALGLRNPFTFDIHPTDGRMFINDVGFFDWEEINQGFAGANYGWPQTEGPFDPQQHPAFTPPIFAYSHSGTGDCAITGGAFYAPTNPTFPAEFHDAYFFADYCGNWIRAMDFPGGQMRVREFATNTQGFVVDLRVGHDGSLYYLSRTAGSVWRIRPSDDAAPHIGAQPESVTVSTGGVAMFSVSAVGAGTLSYQWQRNGQDIPGADSPALGLQDITLDDHLSVFRCIVSNAFGQAISADAVLYVTTNQPPSVMILSPEHGAPFRGGQTIEFSGLAVDPEDGSLLPAAYSWRVVLHHDEHTHPFMPETHGITQGSFVIPTGGHTETNIFYRIHLTAVDDEGIANSTFVDIMPIVVTVGVQTSPAPGLTLFLDGGPMTSPSQFLGVAGVLRLLEAPAQQVVDGQEYEFVGWSDGGERVRLLETPDVDTTLTALYRDRTPPAVVASGFDDEQAAPRPHQVWFEFSEDISQSLNREDVLILRAQDLYLVPSSQVDVGWDAASRRARFGITSGGGVLPDGDYFALIVGGIFDVQGTPLAEPAATRFFVFRGDANHDRSIDLADFAIMAGNFGSPGGYSAGDFDYDGTIGIGDFAILAAKFNTTLPQARVPGEIDLGSPRPASAMPRGAVARGGSLFSGLELDVGNSPTLT